MLPSALLLVLSVVIASDREIDELAVDQFGSPIAIMELPPVDNVICTTDSDCVGGTGITVTRSAAGFHCSGGQCACFDDFQENEDGLCECRSHRGVPFYYSMINNRCMQSCDGTTALNCGVNSECVPTRAVDTAQLIIFQPRICRCPVGDRIHLGRCVRNCAFDRDCSPDGNTYPTITCDGDLGKCVCNLALGVEDTICRCNPGAQFDPSTGNCRVECEADNQCLDRDQFNGREIIFTHPDAACVNNRCNCRNDFWKRTTGDQKCECRPPFRMNRLTSTCTCSADIQCFEQTPSLEPFQSDWEVTCQAEGACSCGSDYVRTTAGKCRCKEGLFQDEYGLCVICLTSSHCDAEQTGLGGISCVFGRCTCPPELRGGGYASTCHKCTTNSDCSPYGTVLPEMVCGTSGICDCQKSDQSLSKGACACTSSDQMVSTSGDCVTLTGCRTSEDCILTGQSFPQTGVECIRSIGLCRCTGDFQLTTRTDGNPYCTCREAGAFISPLGTCGVCREDYDCLSGLLTAAITTPPNVACSNFKCSCAGDYEPMGSKCTCVAGKVFDRYTGFCRTVCTTNDNCYADANVERSSDVKCIVATGNCECGFGGNYVLDDSNQCRLDVIREDVRPVSRPEETVENLEAFCSLDVDCLPGFDTESSDPFPTDVFCDFRRRRCQCRGMYESVQGTVCKPTPAPVPKTAITLSLLYPDIDCNSDNIDIIVLEISRIWGRVFDLEPSEIKTALKCGSVGFQSRLSVLAPLLRISARKAFVSQLNNFIGELSNFGEPSTFDVRTGTGLCPVGFPVKAAEGYLGVCQPTVCHRGYTLISTGKLEYIDLCADLLLTPTPPRPAALGLSKKIQLVDLIIVIVSCSFICMGFIMLFILWTWYNKRRIGGVFYILDSPDVGIFNDDDDSLLQENNGPDCDSGSDCESALVETVSEEVPVDTPEDCKL